MMNQLKKFPLVSLIFLAACVGAICSDNAFAQCEIQQLTSPDPEAEDGFAGVSLDGNVAVVGDRFAFDMLGAIYVYRRYPDLSTDWKLEAVLTSPLPDPEEGFSGGKVNGNVIVVGVENAAAPEFHRGRAYVYRYDPEGQGKWEHEATLTASDGDSGDEFGWSVSVYGNVILIGARNDENDGVPQSGSAYVFRYDPQTKQWLEEAKLTDPNGKQLDLFGFAVAVCGNVALISAGTDELEINAGSVFVFRHDPTDNSLIREWLLEAQLTAFDAAAGDLFGWSVNLFGNLALITAPQSNGQTGSAYVFRYTGKQWEHEIKLVAADPVGPFPLFGRSSSIHDETILIGAPSDFALGAESGAAHLFRETTTGWEEVAKLTASDGAAGDFFGVSVAVSGDIGLIGAHRQSDSDTVYVFDLDTSPADLDCDGVVGLEDLITLLGAWGSCADCFDCDADLDGNCIINTNDLLILFTNWELHP